MVKRISWIIWHNGLNVEELRKEGKHYVLVTPYMSRHADFLTTEMKWFKRMFHERRLISCSTVPTKYVFEVRTDKGAFRHEETERA